jgi:MFS family permease
MHHHENFWWYIFPKKELSQMYFSIAVRSFAISLISLFIPLYLYIELGFSLEQVLHFYLFYSIIFAVSSPLAAKFAARFGLKHSVLFSVPFYILFIISLYLLSIYSISLLIIAALAGWSLAFYWMGMHLIFHHVSGSKFRGAEVGKRRFYTILAAAIAPFLGGFLIKYSGFFVVFCLTALLLVGSVLFLFLSKENNVKYHFSVRTLLNKDHWKNSLFFVSRGVRIMAGGVIWPLFIFVILKDYFSLGIVGSILSGASAFLVLFVGKWSDKIGKRKIIRWTVGFESLSWIFRALVGTVTQVFGATFFGALTWGSMEAPIIALEYDKGSGRGLTNFFVSREIFICLGRILLLTFVLLTGSLSGGLLFTGFANLAALLF